MACARKSCFMVLTFARQKSVYQHELSPKADARKIEVLDISHSDLYHVNGKDIVFLRFSLQIMSFY